MFKIVRSSSFVLCNRDKILIRNVLIKRRNVLIDKIKSITIEVHKIEHKKNLSSRLFMYKEELAKIEYLIDLLG